MSTIKVNNVIPPNAGEGVKIDGLQMPTAGPLSNRNLIINGACNVDQRNAGAQVTPTGTYTFFLDRYAMWHSTGSGHTIQQVADAPVGFKNSFKLTVGTGATPTGSDYGRITYSVEGYDAIPLNLGSADAQAFTVSFYVKVSVAGTYGVQLYGTTALIKYQKSFSIASGEVNTWVRRSFTVPAGTFTTGSFNETNGMAITIAFDVGEGPNRSVSEGYYASASSGGALGLTGGTKILATSSATYQFTGLQLELGSKMTEFEHRSYGDELQRSQRYFFRLDLGEATANTTHLNFCRFSTSSGAGLCFVQFPVTMRDNPTYTTSASGTFLGPGGGYVGTPTMDSSTFNGAQLRGGSTQGTNTINYCRSDAEGETAFFNFYAEL